MYHNESSTNEDGSETVIETAAFKTDFMFLLQMSWSESELVGLGSRRRLTCKGQNKLEKCCATNAFSGLTKDKKSKEKSCSRNECPVNMQQGRRKLNGEASDFRIVHHLRSLQQLTERMMIEDDLTGIEFNDAPG